MSDTIRGRLGKLGTTSAWFFEPMGAVNQAGRAFLLGQLLSAPASAIMGSFCAITAALVALVRVRPTGARSRRGPSGR